MIISECNIFIVSESDYSIVPSKDFLITNLLVVSLLVFIFILFYLFIFSLVIIIILLLSYLVCKFSDNFFVEIILY